MGAVRKRLEARVKAWRRQIEALTVEAERADPGVSLKYHQEIDDLKARCAVAQSKIDKIAADAGGPAGRRARDGPEGDP